MLSICGQSRFEFNNLLLTTRFFQILLAGKVPDTPPTFIVHNPKRKFQNNILGLIKVGDCCYNNKSTIVDAVVQLCLSDAEKRHLVKEVLGWVGNCDLTVFNR